MPKPATSAKSNKKLDKPRVDKPPSRQGKKVISGYFEREMAKEMKALALERERKRPNSNVY